MSQKAEFCQCSHSTFVHADSKYGCRACKCAQFVPDNSEGFPAKSYMGKPVAVKKHGDGSVTICEEIVQDILVDSSVPAWVRELLK